MKKKKERVTKSNYTSKVPNETQRAAKWAGSNVQLSKRAYKRKQKYGAKFDN